MKGIIFLAFDVCRFCVVIWGFHPRHNGQWPPTSKDFNIRSYPLHYFLILILEKEPVFPFSILSAKQGNYWYHFYNVFGKKRGYEQRLMSKTKVLISMHSLVPCILIYGPRSGKMTQFPIFIFQHFQLLLSFMIKMTK